MEVNMGYIYVEESDPLVPTILPVPSSSIKLHAVPVNEDEELGKVKNLKYDKSRESKLKPNI